MVLHQPLHLISSLLITKGASVDIFYILIFRLEKNTGAIMIATLINTTRVQSVVFH